MQEALRQHTHQIQGLEANEVALCESFNKLQHSVAGLSKQVDTNRDAIIEIQSRLRREAVVGFCGAVVNALSMGIGGHIISATNNVIESIVDFSDIEHVVNAVVSDEKDQDIKLKDMFNAGLQLAEMRFDATKEKQAQDAAMEIDRAMKEGNIMTVIGVSAYFVQRDKRMKIPDPFMVNHQNQILKTVIIIVIMALVVFLFKQQWLHRQPESLPQEKKFSRGHPRCTPWRR
jgi:hypothetical protein